MQGTNLANLLTSGRAPTPESIYAEGGIGQPHEWRMVVTDSHKLVVDASLRPTHLFHLAQDSLEQDNLVSKPQHQETCDAMRARLQRWAVRTGDPIHK
jgi:hypothetical protein